MKTLLKKELLLALHPVNIIFLTMSAFLLIPNYPYYVTFFYTTLGIYFICLTGRENHDVDYTMLLPVRRQDLVRARISMAVIIELTQMVVCIPFAFISGKINKLPNLVGMEANAAFFGLALIILAAFNLVFFPLYYKNPSKVGVSFVISTAVEAAMMFGFEVMTHVVTFVRRYLDTRGSVYMGYKLAVLGVGAVVYIIITLLSCRISERLFEKIDL